MQRQRLGVLNCVLLTLLTCYHYRKLRSALVILVYPRYQGIRAGSNRTGGILAPLPGAPIWPDIANIADLPVTITVI